VGPRIAALSARHFPTIIEDVVERAGNRVRHLEEGTVIWPCRVRMLSE
jgi:hypothetical protein